MEWIKFSDYYPNRAGQVLFLDGNTACHAIVDITEENKVYSTGYLCNSKECNLKSKDCGCELVINENSYWACIPSWPQEMKEECERRYEKVIFPKKDLVMSKNEDVCKKFDEPTLTIIKDCIRKLESDVIFHNDKLKLLEDEKNLHITTSNNKLWLIHFLKENFELL